LVGVVLCLVAALALTAATLSVRGAASGGNVMMIVGLQMFVGAAALGIAALILEDFTVNWTPRLIGAFAYTTLVPGVLATWVWFWLVGRIGAVKAATFHFLNPFFGVAVASVMLNEAVRPMDLIGVAIIAGGILAVQISRQVRQG
ncbi:EamA/RhaT family transporter, partial [Candidatus Falkowbacteria bacterium]|nr:EamA/RhaT family transporter [Candidatus Falkowbacteria bacterium]